ncbi:hypothetical protein [Nocardioides caricicola]|uniref:Secreted protein n=1 Tax=Nocardioides caricicola TaxID=634770 RepID=A0ABW0MY65_9ACTN
MFVRRGPAIVLSLVLGAAALASAPALASDGGAAKDNGPATERDSCGPGTSTRAKLKVDVADGNSSRLVVTGAVWSDDADVWTWRIKHNGYVSDDGRARGSEETDLSFRVIRTMINWDGTDDVVFRAENLRTGEVCRAALPY